jgi:hypothetical protein
VGGDEPLCVRSRQLELALRAFVEEAAERLRQDTSAGLEVPFEVVARTSRLQRTPLYCYRPLTGAFIRERSAQLAELPSYGAAVQMLTASEGVERYLATRGGAHAPTSHRDGADCALRELLNDVFEDQTNFELRSERLDQALARFEDASLGGEGQLLVVATLHGLALVSPEVALTRGLALAHADALRGAPEEATLSAPGSPPHLLAVLSADEDDHDDALSRSRDVLRDLQRALRLFGDGRVTLGAMAWLRVGGGSWRPFVLGGGGRPRGLLVVAPEQEDELRAFCNLVSRRAPTHNELAWALSRFEMGCQRDTDHEALSDYLLALRALLESEGPSSGLLAGRLAALCAVPERRAALAERVAQAVTLERAVMSGTAGQSGGGDALVQAIGDHLRALLRDVICGHLSPDLEQVADGLLRGQHAPEHDPPAIVHEAIDHEPDLYDDEDYEYEYEYEPPASTADRSAFEPTEVRGRPGAAWPAGSPQGRLPL